VDFLTEFCGACLFEVPSVSVKYFTDIVILVVFFSSKLICKLTGDNVNKSEEHIWKHMNGKRFLNKLGQ